MKVSSKRGQSLPSNSDTTGEDIRVLDEDGGI